jgi:hypothetical protein
VNATLSPTTCPRLMADLERGRLPLYLTEEDAKLLPELCAASPGTGGQREAQLFSGLGELLREFWQAQGA